MKIYINVLSVCLLIMTVTTSCDILSEDKGTVYGTWRCFETGDVYGTNTFMVDINESGTVPGEITVTNFGGLGFAFQVQGIVSDSEISFPQQQAGSGTLVFSVSGSGYTTDRFKTMAWTYRIDGDNYSANLTR